MEDEKTGDRFLAYGTDKDELDELTSLQKTQTTTGRLYNLDVVVSIGYRVSSAQATVFRRWATGLLVQYPSWTSSCANSGEPSCARAAR